MHFVPLDSTTGIAPQCLIFTLIIKRMGLGIMRRFLNDIHKIVDKSRLTTQIMHSYIKLSDSFNIFIFC